MIEWIPVAVNEKPLHRGTSIMPDYSAAVIGASVVLRIYGGGLSAISLALTTIPFPTAAEASAWVEANRVDAARPASGKEE